MTKPIALVVGATGMLGGQIAQAIAQKGDITVRAMVRTVNTSDPDKQKTLDALSTSGIELVEGDLLQPSSLPAVCEGVDTVVSAISGDKELTVTDKINLIKAAEAQNVQRMIPSDYALDYRKLDWGDNYNLDMRKQVKEALEESKLSYTVVLNGVFTDTLFWPDFLNIFDYKTNTFNYWGNGETLFDTTTVADTARYVAEAVADSSLSNSTVEVAGTVLSMKQLGKTYEDVTGKQLTYNCLGSVDDLVYWIEKTKPIASSPYEYLPQQYLLAMVSGKGKLDRQDNERYPNIHPASVADYVRNL